GAGLEFQNLFDVRLRYAFAHQLRQRYRINFAGAKQWQLLNHQDFSRGHQFMGTFRLRKAGERGTGRVALACQEDNALALARIGSRYTAGERVRPQIGCERLDCGKRDHLTADLGEALRTPLDGDETVGVDGDDITGVVPTVRRTFKHSGVLRAQISEHYVGPTHIKPSASLDACDRFKPH